MDAQLGEGRVKEQLLREVLEAVLASVLLRRTEWVLIEDRSVRCPFPLIQLYSTLSNLFH